MMEKLGSYSVLLAAFLIQGCAVVKPEFSSSIEASPQEKIGKILIVTNTDERALVNQRYIGLVNGLKEGFSACGVLSEVYKIDQMKIDNNKEIKEKFTQFSADSKMLVNFESASLWRGQGGITGSTFYLVGISTANDSPIWRAKMRYYIQDHIFIDKTGAGRNLGLDIIDQIKKDGILGDCREINRG